MSKFQPIHGFYGTKLYWVYRAMLKRCGVVGGIDDVHAKRYVNRGISVCDDWVNNPSSFYEWAMSSGYEEGLQIDRIDNDGNYEPSNCRWVKRTTNMRNTSLTFPVACSKDGSDVVAYFNSAADAAEFVGVSRSAVLNCVNARQKTAGGYLFWKEEQRAERTCKQVLTECNDGLMPPFTAHCSECGAQWGYTPNYCPSCGAKVVV